MHSCVSKDRLFFHDLINHTHSMLLFVEQKIACGQVVSSQELLLLQEELSLMQLMIVDFFQQEHQSINQDLMMPLKKFYILIQGLFRKYFKDNISLHIHGDIIWQESWAISHLSAYRIFTNLIKNIAEASPKKVEFSFSIENNQLHCIVLNDFEDKVKDGGEGVGLHSIEASVLDINGKYYHDVDYSLKCWKTVLIFPLQYTTLNSSAA